MTVAEVTKDEKTVGKMTVDIITVNEMTVSKMILRNDSRQNDILPINELKFILVNFKSLLISFYCRQKIKK